MFPIEERHAAMDDMAEHAERHGRMHEPMAHPPVSVLPMHLAAAIEPRRNLCAEFSQLNTDKLLEEAEAAMVRLDRAGRPTDYAIVAALVRRVQRPATLDGMLLLDLPEERRVAAPKLRFDGVERRHA